MPPAPRPRVPPYLLMLVVCFVLLGLIGYQTLKDRKISSELLEKNRTLQELLKKERKQIKELQEDFTRMSTQKEQLNGLKEQLIELKRVKTLTDDGKRKLESSFEQKENEVKNLKEKLASLEKKGEQIKLLKKEIMQKDTVIRDLKAQVEAFDKHSSKQLNDELTSRNESALLKDEDNDGKERSKEQSAKENDASEGDEEDLTTDVTMDKTSKGQIERSKEEIHTQDVDPEDEESRVDDREETLANEAGDDAEPEKTHDEDDTDDQPDIDMDSVNKSDLDENEMAAME